MDTRVRVLPPEDVEVAAGQLLVLLDRALVVSPLEQQRSFHLEVIDGRIRHATAYRAQVVTIAERPELGPIAFGMGQIGGRRATLPGSLEDAWPGFAADSLFVWWLAVEPSERRRGVGVAVLDALVAASGCERAWLRVHRDNDAALSLYRSHGWTLLGKDSPDQILGVQVAAPPGSQM